MSIKRDEKNLLNHARQTSKHAKAEKPKLCWQNLTDYSTGALVLYCIQKNHKSKFRSKLVTLANNTVEKKNQRPSNPPPCPPPPPPPPPPPTKGSCENMKVQSHLHAEGHNLV